MEYQFDCKNIMQDCPGSVRGSSEEEVVKAASEHARSAHGLDNLNSETLDKVRAAIVPVP